MKKNSIEAPKSSLSNKSIVHKSSSAIFLVINNLKDEVETRISFLNHFLIKRGIKEVKTEIILRDFSGKVVDKFQLNIKGPKVYSFDPCKNIKKDFVGSVFIFFKSKVNLVVPFSAVVCVIKCKKSICSLHTYGRILEKNELGGNLDFDETFETGWTLRDSKSIESFAVMHNGAKNVELEITLTLQNFQNKIKKFKKKSSLKKYGTLFIRPRDYFSEISTFLNKKIGHAKVQIKGINGIFPRLLCGNYKLYKNQSKDSQHFENLSQIQFTHTNFDFLKISQPDAIDKNAFFNQPFCSKGEVIIYPSDNKNVFFGKKKLDNNKIYSLPTKSLKQTSVFKNRKNLPGRLICASVNDWGREFLPSECSSGIIVKDYVKNKLFWKWGLLKPSMKPGNSILSIFTYFFDERFSKEISIKFYDLKGKLFDKTIKLKSNITISLEEESIFFKRNSIGDIWFIINGDGIEHLHVFTTFIPKRKTAGYIEHSF